MKFKTILIFSLLLILSISFVSASEINETQHGNEINIDDTTTAVGDDATTIAVDDTTTADIEEGNTGNYDELSDEIYNTTEGSVIEVSKDYIGGTDSIIIDGHGNTLDCNLKENYNMINPSASNVILKNLIIINGNNKEGEAIYIAESVKYTIENCTFYQNHADYGGAICCMPNTNLTITNCTFKNNNAEIGGGAIKSSGDIYIYNSTFESNNAEYGGAIYNVRNNAEFTVVNTTFTRNTATHSGGAVCSNSLIYLKQCLFDLNEVTGGLIINCYGGAIRINNNVIINNCTFKNNFAKNYGGAVNAEHLYITDKTTQSFFINNIAYNEKGGAIYAEFVQATNTVFNENSAAVDGGAIYSNGDVDLKKCSFEFNKASQSHYTACYGGAVYSGNDATIDNCTFKNNNAIDRGGAIYASSSVKLINDNLFDGNIVEYYGGAIYTSIFKIQVENTVFSNNKVTMGDGGAIYINNENYVIFSNCSFVNNYCRTKAVQFIWTQANPIYL